MKDDVKALVEELFECGNHPCRVDTDFGHMHREAARILEAQQREIEGLRRQVTAFNQERFRVGQQNADLRSDLDEALRVIKLYREADDAESAGDMAGHGIYQEEAFNAGHAFLAKQGRGG